MVNELKKSKVSHNLILEDRKNLIVSNVNDIDSFDEKQISAVTGLGFLTIKGSSLHVNKFNTETGELNISGKVCELIYSENEKRSTKNFFTRLFK